MNEEATVVLPCGHLESHSHSCPKAELGPLIRLLEAFFKQTLLFLLTSTSRNSKAIIQ